MTYKVPSNPNHATIPWSSTHMITVTAHHPATLSPRLTSASQAIHSCCWHQGNIPPTLPQPPAPFGDRARPAGSDRGEQLKVKNTGEVIWGNMKYLSKPSSVSLTATSSRLLGKRVRSED